MKRLKPPLVKIISFAIITLLNICMASANASLQNPGFENDWDGWSDTDPSAISSVAYIGNKSAKIAGSGGRIEQQVPVIADTNYRLSAYVKGAGTIGAVVGGSTHNASISDSEWRKLDVEFNSGNALSITVFGTYNGDEGRFDNFTLENLGSSGGSPGSSSCTSGSKLSIISASDDGTSDGHDPANVIDGSFASESRWSSAGVKWITMDLGYEQVIEAVDIAWYKGDQRSSFFSIETSSDNRNWMTILGSGQSSGSSSAMERYEVSDSTARYVRLTGIGNTANNWNSILEFDVIGCGEDVEDDLNPSLPPSGNFELVDWYLSVPSDNDGSGTADSIKESELSAGYENNSYFYTASDGGMVFRCPIAGYKTSNNTAYTRTELREMLRRGNTNISTKGVNENNWVFGSAPASARNAAGGVDGVLRATLAVNHVTSTGSSSQVGRVIIGQIHANDDEPLRLYYRKLPGNSLGSIYIAHQPEGGNDIWYEIIGSRSNSALNPSDGIALNEIFSYKVEVVGNTLTVTISREGKADVAKTVDMSSSGYDVSGQYQYFKVGVYNQNNTGDNNDYVQATFYVLDNSHDGYIH
ncbi:polysaccharide lyase family 7 protein [uncultured Microbulbifer sp.]|uniref:polysaccharide lyase family 7 protein n=1 Tax=uncultured Microbulbifer sp. TaxID=348147 RepID=UPI00262C74F8|nr:polysaccharide lyase family 7 protein [uncultured Microbulbifer sp.]